MRTREFGSTGLSVSAIGLGGMPMSLEERPDEATSIRVIHAALDAGMRLIDTADVYCIDDDDLGHNERLIAKALRAWNGRATDVVVATKGGLRRPHGAWTTDGRPEHLTEACEKSLRALGVDRIAVYQLHAPDDDVPFMDSVGALARLREEGKIEHVGLSNVTAAQIDEARGVVPIASVQNRCNPYDLRSFKDGVVATCERHRIAFLPWSPVGGVREHARLGNDRALSEVAKKHDATTYEVALAWLLGASPQMIPIPGASKVENAKSSARAASLTLTSDDVVTLDRELGFRRTK